MGLDMYLYGVKYYSKYERDENKNYVEIKLIYIKQKKFIGEKQMKSMHGLLITVNMEKMIVGHMK